MRRFDDRLLLSSGDLVTFLGCRHASALDHQALDEDLETSDDDPMLAFLKDKGIAHELAYLEKLEASGLKVVRIPDKGISVPDRVAMTIEAMRGGADVVYQAALMHGSWHGFADFLMRMTAPSALGAWSYEVADTKLSSSVKARYAIQLSLYSDFLGRIQERHPSRMSVVLGDGSIAYLPANAYVHYVRLAAARLEAFLADAAARSATVAEPCGHCGECHWSDRCKEAWQAADHLSLVANIRRTQRDRLVGAGITTLAGLAATPATLKVPGMSTDTFTKLRAQARLQAAGRAKGEPIIELLPLAPGKGFARLPHPAAGDLFFDMEGDPLYPGGLEYLFGVHMGDPESGQFLAWWAHDRDAERKAVEDFLDFVADHLGRHPDAHIYHYNHYEVTAVRRLCMSHGTREAVMDDLLRRNKFVDLFKVVREAVLVSEPRYSLKNIEKFYLGKRDGDVATAADSIVAYETWRVSGEQQILDDIEHYNAVDCRSTAALLRWLLPIRPAEAGWFDPAQAGPDEAALERQRQAEEERIAIERALMEGVPEDEAPFRRLVADLVEFHRREAKPGWWAVFDRQTRDEEEIVEDSECLGGLRLEGRPVPEKRSLVWTYRFPPQETKLRKDSKPVRIDTMETAGTVVAIDMDAGIIKLKRGAKEQLPEALNLGPEPPIGDKILREAIRRFAVSVVASDGRFPAIESILRREPPRLRGRAAGEPVVPEGGNLVAGAVNAVSPLDGSHLFIQGPPGTGKTYTTSRVIVAMLKAGKTIGVSSHSHKAINNLLAGVEKAAREQRFSFQGVKKSTAGDRDSEFGGDMIEDVYNNDDVVPGAPLVAGTAWLFARPEFEGTVDYLFVDEAGQVSLANLVAMGTAARNIVLVGDQMQLGQPIQGKHPGESGASCLEHLLQGAATVPVDRGIFLDESWRMHPDVCGWVSEAIYEGRLHSHPSTETQRLLLVAGAHPALAPTGLRFVPVEHQGRSQRSPEEASVVEAVWQSLMGQRWRDQYGKEHVIGAEDVLVVAPYNVQVNTLREVLPDGARVGTVDKFQGQEAAVVIMSMTTSSGDDLPRDIEFLFSKNRLNVAVSRARCLAL
ncbi:MAG: TM0106 family RecB-like putative nuclease, partial [Caulobacter sp.]|nr:TM0106 family RecB-like putative nuclease [Caulobacter sp.]